MGQYYMATIISKEGDIKAISPYPYGSGAQLMEHSYISDIYVNSVLNYLNKGDRLYWLGDYAEYEDLHNGDSKITKHKFENLYSDVWTECSKTTQVPTSRETPIYVINATKGCFVELDAIEFKSDRYGNRINVVPLLCSVGNGKGGGDYRGINMGDCGAWAGDEIYATNNEEELIGLSDYTEFIDFYEG